MLLNLSELGLILSFCEDWNIMSREYNVSLMILLWYREYNLSLMILYHPLSSCEPAVKTSQQLTEILVMEELTNTKEKSIWGSYTNPKPPWGIYTHYNILTGISVTEWPLIYFNIIYSDFEDSSNSFKDLLWDPVEQDTRSSKFYLEENVLLWQIYRHLEFWPATWKALLDTCGCFVADTTTRCNLLNWGRGKMLDTKPTGQMNKSSGFPH